MSQGRKDIGIYMLYPNNNFLFFKRQQQNYNFQQQILLCIYQFIHLKMDDSYFHTTVGGITVIRHL